MSKAVLNAHAIDSVAEELEDMKDTYLKEHGWKSTIYLLESGDALWEKIIDGTRYVVPFSVAENIEEFGLRI